MNARRIALIVGLTILISSGAAAQQPGKVPKIGWLSPGVRSNRSDLQEAFVKGLQDLGYVEGQNIVIERREAEGRLERCLRLQPSSWGSASM